MKLVTAEQNKWSSVVGRSVVCVSVGGTNCECVKCAV